MLRWSLLFLATGLTSLSLLTVVRSPDWSAWRLGVVAGEFGHWLAVVPLVLALVVVRVLPRSGMMWLTVGLAVVAGGLFLVPTVQAWRVGRSLPGRLQAAFGAGNIARSPFSVARYFGRPVEAGPVETLSVSETLPLDFYRPAGSGREPAACIVVVHGGGWETGDRKQLPELNHHLARQGYAVAAISYRLAPQHIWPAQREDVLSAIAFLKARAPALGIDPQRLVILGRSAGGQIAEVVAGVARDPAIRGLIALYAPSDLYFGYVNTHENDMLRSPALMRRFLGGPPETARANFESASALNFVTASSPPTLLIHGDNDAVAWWRHSERMAARLQAQGVPHVYVQLPWATHAFDYNLRGPGGQLTVYAIEWFLAAVTR